MSLVLEKQLLPGLNLPKNISPDLYLLEEDMKIKPKDNFIISRDKQGKTVSMFKDDVWDFSMYVSSFAKMNKKMYFKDIEVEFRNEAKRLMFIIMLFKNGRGGSSLSNKTLINGYFAEIKKLASYCVVIKKSIKEVLEDTDLLMLHILKNASDKFESFLTLLYDIGNIYTGIEYRKNRKILNALSSKKKNYEQTSVIPSRILKSSLSQRWSQFNEISSCSDLLLKFLKSYQSDLSFASSKGETTWEKEMNKKKWTPLLEIFDKYNIKNRANVPRFIRMFQGTCKHLIHAYSGMRDNEVISLEINCFEEPFSENKTIMIIGKTTKLHGFQKSVKWVSSLEIKPVIKLLSSISLIIASKHKTKEKLLPLFISSQLLYHRKTEIKIAYLDNKDQLPFYNIKEMQINADDINEIDDINFLSPSSNNGTIYEPGEVWEFKSHQYRRSLCVYALQSGLVSIGALQLQLKHLFREMTLYYGNGASRAKELFEIPKNHISMDFEHIKQEMDTISYIKNVIFSDEDLFGNSGTLFDKKSSSVSNDLNIFELREDTLKKIKDGEIVYKETALGGCISKDPCNNRLIRSIHACIDCEGAILKKSKIDKVIDRQESLLSCLDESSIEYRTELEDLNILKKEREKILKKHDNE